MTAASSGDHASGVPAGWHIDPDDSHMLRWWDGSDWGDQTRPRLVAAAEDQTRIFTEHTRLLAEIRSDVSTIKAAVLFWFILSLFGLIGYIAIVNSH